MLAKYFKKVEADMVNFLSKAFSKENLRKSIIKIWESNQTYICRLKVEKKFIFFIGTIIEKDLGYNESIVVRMD